MRRKLVGLTDVQSSFLLAVTVGNYNTWETYLFDTKLWLRSDDAMATRTSRDPIVLDLKAKQQLCRCITLFVLFLSVFARLRSAFA